MALYDDPKKKRPLTALEQQAAATQADYGASVDRMQTAQKQATGIQIPMPIIQEGRGSFKSIARPGQDAAVTALRTLGGVARQEQDKQTAMIPTFQAQAAGLRAQAGADRAKAATLGANKLLANVGAAPIAAPLATPRPAVQPATAAIASPGAGTKPRSAAELDQASKAEVAARTSTQSPASPPTGAGAPSAAGGAAPKPYTLRPDGVAVVKVSNGSNAYGATGASVANAQGRIGSVNTQNFGNPVVPQGPGAIARPGVASTFGLGVNDPRLNDQRVESVNIQRPGNLTFNPAGNAETFNARQDREGRQATNSAIDLALFQARGKPGAEAAISDLLQTQARLNSGAEGLSQEAIQNRANRDNAYGIADLNNAGENNRAGIQADVARSGQQVTREGQQLTYQSSMADIARPQLKQDANGNYINVSGDIARPVLDAQGNVVRGPQDKQATPRDFAGEQAVDYYSGLQTSYMEAANNTMDAAERQKYMTLAEQAGQQAQALIGGGQQAQAPQVGTVKNGYRFKGGNPADQKNWEKVQ